MFKSKNNSWFVANYHGNGSWEIKNVAIIVDDYKKFKDCKTNSLINLKDRNCKLRNLIFIFNDGTEKCIFVKKKKLVFGHKFKNKEREVEYSEKYGDFTIEVVENRKVLSTGNEKIELNQKELTTDNFVLEKTIKHEIYVLEKKITIKIGEYKWMQGTIGEQPYVILKDVPENKLYSPF